MTSTWKDHTLDFPAPVMADVKSHMEPPTGKEKLGLLFLAVVATATFMFFGGSADPAHAKAVWNTNEASYYEPTGNATACGNPMTNASWHVASLGGTKAECGDRLRICRRSRCVNVTVKDTGPSYGWRRWDLTPRVKRALRCGDLCVVRWTYRAP